MTCR